MLPRSYGLPPHRPKDYSAVFPGHRPIRGSDASSTSCSPSSPSSPSFPSLRVATAGDNQDSGRDPQEVWTVFVDINIVNEKKGVWNGGFILLRAAQLMRECPPVFLFHPHQNLLGVCGCPVRLCIGNGEQKPSAQLLQA